MNLRALAIALALCPAAAAADADPAALAEEAAALLADAALKLEAAEGARDRIDALTETVRAYETGLAALREGLRRAVLEERALRSRLGDRDRELGRILAVLQGIRREKDAVELLHPAGPLPAVRAALLASDLVPGLNARARVLAAEVEELADVVALRRAAESQLETALAEVREARLKLAEAVSNRTDLPPRRATDAVALRALLEGAETLSAFADSFMSESPWTGTVDESWPWPVRGRLLRRFDEADAAGVRRPGWIIATDPEALIAAPMAGTVRFADQVPEFGGVLIVEPRAGELLVLAGAGTVFARRGQIVSAGEALGLMPAAETAEQEKLIESADGGGQRARETLYIELRQGQDAIDPAVRFDPEAE